jgi:hypothetical protein
VYPVAGHTLYLAHEIEKSEFGELSDNLPSSRFGSKRKEGADPIVRAGRFDTILLAFRAGKSEWNKRKELNEKIRISSSLK